MTKTKFNELMKMYGITPNELDDIFAFVTDLLYLKRREMEQNEPWASRSIDATF